MSSFVVNGRFLSHRVTGVQRYAIEVSSRIAASNDIMVPTKSLKGFIGHLWEQLYLGFLGDGRLLWSPSGSGPLVRSNQVVTIHDLSFVEHPEWFSRSYGLLYRYMTPLLCRRVRHIIAVSEFTKQKISECFGIDPSRISVIPNGVDARFRPVDEDARARCREKYSGGLPYALCVGSLDPRKNLRRLILAWKKVSASYPSCQLLVAGGESSIFNSAIDCSLPLGVKVLGYVDDAELPLIYASATAFVYPSLYEGFGLPPLEAMASGVPVVCSNATSLPEVVGDVACLVDPDSVDSIAEGVKRVVGDEGLRALMREKGLVRAAEFSWDRTSKATLDLLCRISEE